MSATFITLYYKLMMTSAFVQTFTLPFFVSCADTQHTHQRKILCNFFDVPSPSVLPREITGFSWSSEDFCRWRTVDCADGAVTSIHYQRERHPISLWIHWLPPTATYVHLSNVKLRQGASTVQLPRALQYLCLSQCDTDMRDSVPAIDLRRLPARLEELIIINCRFRGNFDLIFLPSKLRLLILNIPVAQNLLVCVNYENLPDSLHLGCIQTVLSTDL